MKEKTETLWIRVTPEQKAEIKQKAKEAGCTASDYCLSKILDLPLEAVPEKEYKVTAGKYEYSVKANPKRRKTIMRSSYEKTREFAQKLEEEVRSIYVSAGFTFCLTPEKDTDTAVAIMDCNESLSNLDYPLYIKEIARNIDGSITFEAIVDEE